MHLEDDYAEILAGAQAVKESLTGAARGAERAKTALPAAWWAEPTVDFTDKLLRPGRFLDRWLRPLGMRLDINADWQLEIPDMPETREMTQRLRHKTPAERLRRTVSMLEQRSRDIQQAEEELRLDEERRVADKEFPGTRGRSAPQPLPDDERQRRQEVLAGLRKVQGAALANLGTIQRRPDEHDELVRSRRARIVAALLSEDWCGEPYRPFALVAAALWRRVPPQTPKDLVRPPEEIAATLSAWRWNVAPKSVPTVRKRVGPVGPEGAISRRL